MTLQQTTSTDLLKYRFTGAKGTPITMHRALRSLPFDATRWATVLVLPLIFEALLLINVETIAMLWTNVFTFFTEHLNLPAQVVAVGVKIPFGAVALPALDIGGALPSSAAVWRNMYITIAVFVISLFFPRRMMPLSYLIRAGLVVQFSASIYFLLHPDYFPYTLGGYVQGCTVIGFYMLFLVPIALALVYYIFDFSIIKKMAITFIILMYFILLIPFQYMAHALIINDWGYLFLPTLYLLFGPLLQTLMFVGWYSWAMSRKA